MWFLEFWKKNWARFSWPAWKRASGLVGGMNIHDMSCCENQAHPSPKLHLLMFEILVVVVLVRWNKSVKHRKSILDTTSNKLKKTLANHHWFRSLQASFFSVTQQLVKNPCGPSHALDVAAPNPTSMHSRPVDLVVFKSDSLVVWSCLYEGPMEVGSSWFWKTYDMRTYTRVVPIIYVCM